MVSGASGTQRVVTDDVFDVRVKRDPAVSFTWIWYEHLGATASGGHDGAQLKCGWGVRSTSPALGCSSTGGAPSPRLLADAVVTTNTHNKVSAYAMPTAHTKALCLDTGP